VGKDLLGHHGHLSRKKRLPAAGAMITVLLVPSSVGTVPTDTQLVVFRSALSWRLNNVWVVGQTMATALVPVLMVWSSGAPGV